MLALANVALERDLWLISDEIYRDLSYADPWRPVQYGDFVSLASSGLIDDRLVVLGSLSKSHAMTGWRMGWMIAPQSLIAQATALADIVFHGLPGFVQEAALAAILDKTTPDRAVEVYRCRREAFAAGLGQSRAPIARMPEAGPFILCDIRNTGLTGSQFAELALLEAGVALLDGGRFGRSTEGFVRAALTRPRGRAGQGRPPSRRAFSSLRGDARQDPDPCARRAGRASRLRVGGPRLQLSRGRCEHLTRRQARSHLKRSPRPYAPCAKEVRRREVRMTPWNT